MNRTPSDIFEENKEEIVNLLCQIHEWTKYSNMPVSDMDAWYIVNSIADNIDQIKDLLAD